MRISRNFTLLLICQNSIKQQFHVGAIAFRRSVKMHSSKKNVTVNKSAMPKSTYFSYLFNIDMEIFCKYRIDIMSILKK